MDNAFFTGYRKTAVRPQEILVSIEIPYSKKVDAAWTCCLETAESTTLMPAFRFPVFFFVQYQFVSAFKQSPRREDDISIVTAAMSVTFGHGGVVEDLKLSYGGMAPTTVMASRTAKRLLGR